MTHGEWIKYAVDIAEHPWHCSCCGWSNRHIDRYVNEFDYCPKCGTIMDANKRTREN